MIDAPQLAAFLAPPRPRPEETQSTGVAALDQVLGPLLPHDIVLIDARNEEEATGLAASLVSAMASSGKTMIILSLRIGAEAFAEMATSCESNTTRGSTLSSWQIWVEERAQLDVLELIPRTAQGMSRIDLILVDGPTRLKLDGRTPEQALGDLCGQFCGTLIALTAATDDEIGSELGRARLGERLPIVVSATQLANECGDRILSVKRHARRHGAAAIAPAHLFTRRPRIVQVAGQNDS